ncbi:MAG: hypothetical protein SGI88_17220 [Candidatus Hydrogenedentes bacterium]|nr:hypothetical protein [Candidatus Hydrogenedentota bacterium]
MIKMSRLEILDCLFAAYAMFYFIFEVSRVVLGFAISMLSVLLVMPLVLYIVIRYQGLIIASIHASKWFR